MFDLISIGTFFKKNFTRKDVLFVVGLILLYLATRLINLEKFPIFSDEGIYIHWSKVAWHDASWRFISLTDGKQPLQTWGTIPFLKLFSSDLLLGARMFAVFTGFIALVGMFTLLFQLFGKRAAFIGTFLYVLTPYFLFYDRLALVDSGVNAGFIWILFLSVLLVKKRRLDYALLYGLVGGLALLAKSSAQLFIGLSAFAPLLLLEKKKSRFVRNSLNYLVLLGIGAGLAIALYNIQRLSPFFHYVAEKNTTFVMTFAEFKAHPFAVFFSNIQLIPVYVLWELGWISGLFAAAGIVVLFKKNWRLALYLSLWVILPFFSIAFFMKVMYPRHIIFFPTLLIIFATVFIAHLKNKRVLWTAVVVFTLTVLYFDYTIVFQPAKIPFPPVDRGQYIEGWPAGWGAKEIVQFAKEKSLEKPVILLAEGNFGMTGDVLDVFVKTGDAISIRGYWPLEKAQLEENQKDVGKNYVYAVFSHKLEYPSDWPITRIKKYEKPGNQSALLLYELQPLKHE